jgi:hypothetical protein
MRSGVGVIKKSTNREIATDKSSDRTTAKKDKATAVGPNSMIVAN